MPRLSLVIPVYNRTKPLLWTLDSVRAAARDLPIEVVVVDDGSEPPLSETIPVEKLGIDTLIRQANQGLLFARLTGLAAAKGELVMFLDSDDLISDDKLRLHLDAMAEGRWDVTYTDSTRAQIDASGHIETIAHAEPPYRSTEDATDFFINVQPAPHAPVFRTDFLRRALAAPQFPPRKEFNPVAEIWFYHKAAVLSAKTKHLSGPHSIVGQHSGERLTDHWEKLGIASLAVMEHFIADTPPGPESDRARGMVAFRALSAWRRLPHGMPRGFQSRYISVWRAGRHSAKFAAGSPTFERMAALLGTLPLAWALRRWRNASYRSIRTMSSGEFRQLMEQTPAPPTAKKTGQP